MKLLIVLATFVVAALTDENFHQAKSDASLFKQDGMIQMQEGRIVGGSAVTIQSFPWIVSLRRFGAHSCGATIIASNRILTAAHCTIGGTHTGFEVRAGSTLRLSGGQLIGSERLIPHPQFSLSTLNHDICLIWLNSEINLSLPGVAVIQLHAPGADLTSGTMVTVAGWGATCEGDADDCPSSETLRAVSVPIVSYGLCNALYGGGVFTSQLCAGFADGERDSCQGDSGGPLSLGNTLVGVVSRGNGCGRPNQPGIYARVAYYRTWISQTV